MYKVLVEEDAENDIDSAYLWYELQMQDLGKRFYNHIQIGVAYIAKNPFSGRKIYKNVRRYIVHKFPFGIYYLIDDESMAIKIVGVIHFKRSRRVLKRRI